MAFLTCLEKSMLNIVLLTMGAALYLLRRL